MAAAELNSAGCCRVCFVVESCGSGLGIGIVYRTIIMIILFLPDAGQTFTNLCRTLGPPFWKRPMNESENEEAKNDGS